MFASVARLKPLTMPALWMSPSRLLDPAGSLGTFLADSFVNAARIDATTAKVVVARKK